MTAAVFVDGHVHFHNCFEPAAFLAAAHNNFQRQACALGVTEWWGTLLMTESASADWFRGLAEGRTEHTPSGWRVRPLSEPCSLALEGPGGAMLTVIAGRQIVTAERLEVLAIGMPRKIPDGTPLRDCMQVAACAGALRILPWGNGKWLGARGQLIRSLIEQAQAGEFFLGDNSGRLRFAPCPKEFLLGRKKGLWVLPGSDPLPFASESDKVGSYGFSLPMRPDQQNPYAWLRARLASDPQQIRPYGRRESVGRFVRNQLAMQIHKRLA